MSIVIALAVYALLVPSAWGNSLDIEAEVLEGSEEFLVPGMHTLSVRYAIVHHAKQEDRAVLSNWLHSQDSLPVMFATRDGAAHRGVLRRLKHCFGRGLMVFTDPVRLAEKQVVRLSLDRAP